MVLPYKSEFKSRLEYPGLGRGSFAWNVENSQEYWLYPFCLYLTDEIPVCYFEGIVHNTRHILGISLFIRKTSVRANQYLINFRLEFFTNIGSRHDINLLNKDTQVLSLHSVMLITQHTNHFVWLDYRFRQIYQFTK